MSNSTSSNSTRYVSKYTRLKGILTILYVVVIALTISSVFMGASSLKKVDSGKNDEIINSLTVEYSFDREGYDSITSSEDDYSTKAVNFLNNLSLTVKRGEEIVYEQEEIDVLWGGGIFRPDPFYRNADEERWNGHKPIYIDEYYKYDDNTSLSIFLSSMDDISVLKIYYGRYASGKFGSKGQVIYEMEIPEYHEVMGEIE